MKKAASGKKDRKRKKESMGDRGGGKKDKEQETLSKKDRDTE